MIPFTTRQIIREPYNGIYYYAAPSAASITYRGNHYYLSIWRETLTKSRKMAEAARYSGYAALVRKIPFRKGGMFKKDKGKRVIYCYGVYVRGPV